MTKKKSRCQILEDQQKIRSLNMSKSRKNLIRIMCKDNVSMVLHVGSKLRASAHIFIMKIWPKKRKNSKIVNLTLKVYIHLKMLAKSSNNLYQEKIRRK